MDWRVQHKVESVGLSLTDREANDLYGDIYRMQRDLPGAREDYPVIFAVYDALAKAGVFGDR